MSNAAEKSAQHTAIYLDPDYRKQPDTSKPYCIRCQKPVIAGGALACTEITVEDAPYVQLGGSKFIGKDCWRIIIAAHEKRAAQASVEAL